MRLTPGEVKSGLISPFLVYPLPELRYMLFVYALYVPVVISASAQAGMTKRRICIRRIKTYIGIDKVCDWKPQMELSVYMCKFLIRIFQTPGVGVRNLMNASSAPLNISTIE